MALTDALTSTNEDIFRKENVNVIDFGYATPYLEENDSQKHVKKTLLDAFHGNMMFASLNQMSFHTTGRRDDIISVFYILVFLLNEGSIPGVSPTLEMSSNEQFLHIRDAKMKQSSK